MRSSTLPIASPCHESWDAMSGEATQRFCGVCQKDVHNLSAMGHDEAQALLREKAGQHLCVRYSAESDGTLRFRDLVPKASLTRRIVRSAFAATMLAACAPHGEGPAQELGQAIIESIREATVPTSDGGCDYTTGPFTTFHLPPGHVLCRDAGPAVAIEAGPYRPQDNPPPVPMMGAPPPLPVQDPPPVMRMGEAMAVPEHTSPFEPCDPKPGFAPPPPPRPGEVRDQGEIAAPPAPPPVRELMGAVAAPEPEPELMGKIAAPQD
jgi:hypothetical protein